MEFLIQTTGLFLDHLVEMDYVGQFSTTATECLHLNILKGRNVYCDSRFQRFLSMQAVHSGETAHSWCLDAEREAKETRSQNPLHSMQPRDLISFHQATPWKDSSSSQGGDKTFETGGFGDTAAPKHNTGLQRV